MKIKVTLKVLLLFAGILVALATILLFWKGLPPLDQSFAIPSYSEIVPYEVHRLINKTFSVFL